MKDLDKFIGLIKPFSLMELYGLNCVVNKLDTTKKGKSLNLVRGEIESILTIYKSRNVFEIVEAQKKEAIPAILELVGNELEIVAKDENSVNENIIDTPLIRRLYRILKMPTIKDPNEKDEEGKFFRLLFILYFFLSFFLRFSFPFFSSFVFPFSFFLLLS